MHHALTLLGWRSIGQRRVPNTADSASEVSMTIAARVLDVLGAEDLGLTPDISSGRPLEQAVAADLAEQLTMDPVAVTRGIHVSAEPRLVTEFLQYAHLRELDHLAKSSPELRVTLGTDYLIRPDVVLSLPGRTVLEPPFLHAVVSCKWTIRSDRVQNIRHEYNLLMRHRRERLPHLVTVTAEPLPTRLASIARGTGEVDATYHIAFDALAQSIRELNASGRISREQLEAWEEAVGQGRIRPYSQLADTLARW